MTKIIIMVRMRMSIIIMVRLVRMGMAVMMMEI